MRGAQGGQRVVGQRVAAPADAGRAAASAWRSSTRSRVDLPAPVGADQAQGLARLQAQRDARPAPAAALAGIAEADVVAAPAGRARSVVDACRGRRRVSGASSSGCRRASAARPRSISDSTQPAANIGQISWPRYMREAGERADRELAVPDQLAAEAQRQAGGRGQGQADRRLVGRFPFLRASGWRRRRRAASSPNCCGAALLPGRARAGCARRPAFPARGR